MPKAESTINVEWWDEQTGTWGDLGEAKTLRDAKWRIAGLVAADETPQRYRIFETRITAYPHNSEGI